MIRIIQPILLGTAANIVINFIFTPENPDFLWSEFVAAIILSFPITELNRLLDHRLVLNNHRIKSFGKRLLMHCIVLFLSIGLVLNGIGNLYVYLKGDTFYSFQETLIINSVSFFIAAFLTGFNWMAHYYQQWKIAESKLLKSEHTLSEVNAKQLLARETIPVTKGKKKANIRVDDVMAAYVKNGVTMIETTTELRSVIFNGTLRDLQKVLPNDIFFTARRNRIIRKDTILSITSGRYGKIELELKVGNHVFTQVTISREKAATFRKWINTGSPDKQ